MNIHLFRLKFVIYFFGCMFFGIGTSNLFKYILIRQLKTPFLKKNEVLPYYDLKIFCIFIILGISFILIYNYAFKINLDDCKEKDINEINEHIKNTLIMLGISGFIFGIFISFILLNTNYIHKYFSTFLKFDKKYHKKRIINGKRNYNRYKIIFISCSISLMFWVSIGLVIYSGIILGKKFEEKKYKCLFN